MLRLKYLLHPLASLALLGVVGGSALVPTAAPAHAAIVSLNVTVQAIEPLEGVTFNGPVASFPDPGVGPYTAHVDWGDSTQTDGGFGTSCVGSACSLTVFAEHVYAKVGQFTMTVHVFNLLADGFGAQSITVKDAPLGAPTGRTIGMVPNQPVTGIVGTFTDADLLAGPDYYQIDIDWGDGSATSRGTADPIVLSGGTPAFNILTPIGGHTYTVAGTYNVTATVTDIRGGPQPRPNAVVAHSVIYAPIITTFNTGATEGAFFQTVLSRIPMLDVHIGYQKVIDWGDGTIEGPTPVAQGCFSNPNTGQQDCFWLAGGGHTYPDEGTFTATTTYTGADGSGGTATSQIIVGDAQLADQHAPAWLAVTPGKNFSGPVATFIDQNPFGAPGDFGTPTIDWGDGSASGGLVSTTTGCCAGSFFQVTGNHVYARPGPFTVRTSVSDKGGSTLLVTETAGGLNVTMAPITLAAGAPSPNGFLVATFQTTAPCSDASPPAYTDTIDWGDGTSSTGGIGANGGCAGTFSVGDRHTYATGGFFPVAITVTGSDGRGGSALGTATVNPVTVPQTNPAPLLGSLSPDGARQASGGLTVLVSGTNFTSGSVVRWNGADLPTSVLSLSLLTALVPAADLATSTDLATATITVFNPAPGGGTSNPLAFTVSSARVKAAQSAIAASGASASASTAPTVAGDAGVAVTLTNTASAPVTLTAATYVANPTAAAVFDAGGGFLDVRLSGPSVSGSAAARFYYPSTVTGAAETALQLRYFNGSTWANARGSGNVAPTHDTRDNLDGTTSGGRFALTFDAASTPPLSALSGTVFALSGTPAVATPTPTPSPTATSTPTATPTVIVGGGGGGDDGGGPPNPSATPELDSLVLFGTGIAGLAGLARLRLLAARRKRRPDLH